MGQLGSFFDKVALYSLIFERVKEGLSDVAIFLSFYSIQKTYALIRAMFVEVLDHKVMLAVSKIRFRSF